MRTRIRRLVLPACLVPILLMIVSVGGGCAHTQPVTITTKPADATIRIDGIDRGRGPITHPFVFNDAKEVHRVTAIRRGFKDTTEIIGRDFNRNTLLIELRPLTRDVNVLVQPLPAILKINGRQVKDEPVSAYSTTLEFVLDAKNQWTTYTLRAERPGFAPTEKVISYPDPVAAYELTLEPMRKDISITTNPPGATVYLEGVNLGPSPVKVAGRAFPVDLDTGESLPQKLRVTKPGYDPIEREIAWDNGLPEYHVELEPKSKTVRITTEPAATAITLEGKELTADDKGVFSIPLKFLPINDTGELQTYKGVATAKAGEWYPQPFTLTWDNGRSDYKVALREVLTKPLSLIAPSWERDGTTWTVAPRVAQTIAMKSPSEEVEGSASPPEPVRLTRLAAGASVDSLAISPDGSKLLFTVLTGVNSGEFRSQMYVVSTSTRADGSTTQPSGTSDESRPQQLFSDGKALELYPTFTPGGDKVVFSSNRAGRRLSIWQMSTTGAPGITQLTTGENNDVWPSVDSDPKQRIYYASLIDGRPEPLLFSSVLGTTLRNDLQTAGIQPRISPRNDFILFTNVNEQTGKRDICRMPAAGGPVENLTNSPEVDEYDPAWNRDGNKIAFAADRALDPIEKRQNVDIWVMDLNKPGQLTQVTRNGSQDDCPVWDPAGRYIYFRSNRGVEWAVWKIPMR